MYFEDERYVRVYTRDTIGWRMLPWQGKCVLQLMFRKVDRAGVIDLGEDGEEGLAMLLDLPLEVVSVGLAGLLKRGTVVQNGSFLVLPRFIEAQEAKPSDKARQKASRERIRDRVVHGPVLDELPRHTVDGTSNPCDGQSQNPGSCDGTVTGRDGPSRGVTDRHTDSKPVTLNHLNHLNQTPPSPPGGSGAEAPPESAKSETQIAVRPVEPERDAEPVSITPIQVGTAGCEAAMEAYAAGIQTATGAPWASMENAFAARRHLVDALRAHVPAGTPVQQALARLRASAAIYASSKNPKFEKGFAISKWGAWLAESAENSATLREVPVKKCRLQSDDDEPQLTPEEREETRRLAAKWLEAHGGERPRLELVS